MRERNKKGTMVMNVELISVIVALAVLLLGMEFSSNRINDFMTLYHKSLSDLARAEIEGKIDRKKHKEAADEINKYYDDFKKGYDRLKWIEWLKQIAPILLMFEILHITLKEFGWSLWYEWICPGLNELYVMTIIFVMLLYLILGLFRITDKKILYLESQIISVIAQYLYGFVRRPI